MKWLRGNWFEVLMIALFIVFVVSLWMGRP